MGMTYKTGAPVAPFNEYLMHALRVEITDRGHNVTSAARVAGCGQQQLSGWLNGVHEMTSERFHQVVTDIGGDPARVFARATEAMARREPLPKKRKRAPKKSPGGMVTGMVLGAAPLLGLLDFVA